MLKKSVLFVCAIASMSLISACSLEEGATENFMCLDDMFSEETSFSRSKCSDKYTCNSVSAPEMYAGTSEQYYKCYLCDSDDNGKPQKYCNGRCVADADSCITETCEPGEFRCKDNSLFKCNEKGGYRLEQSCEPGYLCDEDLKQCKAESCAFGTYKCEGNELLKCNDEGVYALEQSCESGYLCNAELKRCDERGEVEVCIPGTSKCQDEKTLLLCEPDGTMKSVVCDSGCKNDACIKLPTCAEGSYSCDNDVLMKCSGGEWTKETTCSRQYACDAAQKACVLKPLDSDDDGVPDSEDKCPFNPLLTEPDTKVGCHTYVDGVYTIYNPYNLYDLVAILNKTAKVYTKGELTQPCSHIVLARDINFADYADFESETDKKSLGLIDIQNDGSCVVRNWKSITRADGIVFDGKEHTISAKMANGTRCSFGEPLFNQLYGSTVQKLSLDYNSTGVAMLANKIAVDTKNPGMEISNITYEGSISTTTTGIVGGLIAQATGTSGTKYSVTIDNCWPKSIDINALNSTSYIGGVIGDLGPYVKFIPSNNVYNIGTISGEKSSSGVGGLFGLAKGIIENVNSTDYFKFKVGNVIGKGSVGGFAGQLNMNADAKLSNVVGYVDSVSGNGGDVGGFAGKVMRNVKLSHIGLSAKRIESGSTSSSNGVGGLAGYLYNQDVEYIYVQTDEIIGKTNIGGLFGSNGSASTSSSIIGSQSLNYISVTSHSIDGQNSVGGIAGLASRVYTNDWKQIMTLSNIKSASENSISGTVGNIISTNTKMTDVIVASSRLINDEKTQNNALLTGATTLKLEFDNAWYYADAGCSVTTTGLKSGYTELNRICDESIAEESVSKLNASLGRNAEAQWEIGKFELVNSSGGTDVVSLPVLHLPEIEKALKSIAETL